MDMEGTIKAFQYSLIFVLVLYISLCPLRKSHNLVQEGPDIHCLLANHTIQP